MRLPTLLLALLSPQLVCVRGVEFNYEVEKRVTERLTEFLQRPIMVVEMTEKFRSWGGFSRGMGPADRDEYLTFDYLLMKQFADLHMAYYGLEDGVFLGFARDFGTYREPGESAYDPNVDADMTKYWVACVDHESGVPKNCTLPPGSDYIKCVNECELMKCTDAESQRNCSALSDDDETVACEANTKWCRNYLHVKGPPEDHDLTLGFVPRTYYCHDEMGRFTQERGVVVGGVDGATDCYHGDGKTLVNRTLVGDYAYCGGNGSTCSTTFVGGYRSRHYDPRWRNWYKDVKAHQKPMWSTPYPFFTNLAMGITYAKPIYSVQGNISVFEGVLAADYSFENIASFLQEAYANTSTTVAVFEFADPFYIIGTSTGSMVAKKVLESNKTQPCPDAGSNIIKCEVTRVKMSELSGIPTDSVLVRAHAKLKDLGFPNKLISVRETDDLASKVYAVHSKIYEQDDANLKWRTIVLMPSNKAAADTIDPGGPYFIVICFIAGVGFLSCLSLFFIFYSKRQERAVKFADFRFTCAFLMGCILLNGSAFTLLGKNTDPMCMLRMWSFHFCFALAMSPLLVKVWRMVKLVGKTNSFQRVTISHSRACMMTVPIILTQMIILTIFSIVDPPRQTEMIYQSGEMFTQHLRCHRRNPIAFLVVQLLFEGGLVAVGCILSYKSRNVPPKFGEAKQLLAAMYNIAFIGLTTLILTFVIDIDETGKKLLLALGVFWGTVFSSCAFVLPRLMEVREKNKRESETTQHGLIHITGVKNNSLGDNENTSTLMPSSALKMGPRRRSLPADL